MVIVNLVKIPKKGGGAQITIHAWPPWQFGGISFHYFLLFPAFAGKLKPKPKQTMHRKKIKKNKVFIFSTCSLFGFWFSPRAASNWKGHFFPVDREVGACGLGLQLLPG